ncbi:MAG: aminotransferase class I/II-fold pyridoxal phosphate-dependent enzyme, partial [Actinomycetota bacterium]|nr:aminotransferase class I/II-fold pyridoxal phosphate-dependent enzyme [Actinomycetota bacterium]
MSDGSARTDPLPGLPLRPELVGEVPYGAPQLDVAHRLNVNENPYPPSAQMVADVADAVAAATATLNRYPDRDAGALRADLAAYVGTDVPVGPAITAERVWAANGSNEVMVQLLQAFGGPGRVALSFTPTYSMYPDYCRDTFTAYRTMPRRADFTIDLDAALARVAAEQPDV